MEKGGGILPGASGEVVNGPRMRDLGAWCRGELYGILSGHTKFTEHPSERQAVLEQAAVREA